MRDQPSTTHTSASIRATMRLAECSLCGRSCDARLAATCSGREREASCDSLALPSEQRIAEAPGATGTASTDQAKRAWLVTALVIVGLAVGYYLFNRSKAQASTEKTLAQGEAPWQAATL